MIRIFDHRGISGFEKGMVADLPCHLLKETSESLGHQCAIISEGRRPTSDDLSAAMEDSDILLVHATNGQFPVCRSAKGTGEFQICIRVTRMTGFHEVPEICCQGKRLLLFAHDMAALRDRSILREVISITAEQGRALVEKEPERLTPGLRKVFGLPLNGEKWVLPFRILCGGYLLVRSIVHDENGTRIDIDRLGLSDLGDENRERLHRLLVGDAPNDMQIVPPKFWNHADTETERAEILSSRMKQSLQTRYWRIWDDSIAQEVIDALPAVEPTGKAVRLVQRVEEWKKHDEESSRSANNPSGVQDPDSRDMGGEFTRIVAEVMLALSKQQAK